MQAELEQSCREFGADCHRAGFDLVTPFRVDWYNSRAEAADLLPDFGRKAALAFLVGNTRELWGPLHVALSVDTALQGDPDPLDAYVVSKLGLAVQRIIAPTAIVWAHLIEPRPLPVQRVAEAVGFAVISPSHLSVHPLYGPWFALRAVVVVDADGASGEPPPLVNPCAACHRPCMPALDDALRAAEREGLTLSQAVCDDWLRWARIRDVCPEGRRYRYSDDQIAYHYTKNRGRLLAARSEQ